MAVDGEGKEIVGDGTKGAEEVVEDKSLLDGGGGEKVKTPEEIAAEQATADAAKVAAEAETKRILDTEDANLSAEDLAKKPELVKAAEEKRLLDTPKDQLSAEDQVKQAALLKAQEDAKKAKEAKGAPEKYEDFKLPDGAIVDQPLLEEFKTTAKELNLTQEKAQKLVDLELKVMDAYGKQMAGEFVKIKNQWKQDTRDVLGATLKADLLIASKAIEKLGTPELRKMLNETGVGNRKELVKFFVEVGKLVREDPVIDGSNKTGQKSDAELFYGDSMKDK